MLSHVTRVTETDNLPISSGFLIEESRQRHQSTKKRKKNRYGRKGGLVVSLDGYGPLLASATYHQQA